MREWEIPDPPRVVEPLEIVPIDTSSTCQKYLLKTADGRRFEISQFLFNIVELVDGVRSVDAIATEISQKEGKEYRRGDVETVLARYLAPSGVLAGPNANSPGKKTAGYLRFKIPLLSQKTIRPMMVWFHSLFRPAYLICGLVASLSFLIYFYSLARRPAWEVATPGMINWLGVYAIYLIGTLAHEIGHSSACYHFGAQPGHIGIGLYLYFPVFFTDVSDVWRLRRAERAAVDIAGVYFQLLMLPLLYCLYGISGDSTYVYAIYLMTFSCVTALNPLFRFDGYWLVSDLAGLPNLRKRSEHLFVALMRRFRKELRSSNSADLKISSPALRVLYVYAIASNVFFLFFIYELVSALPQVFRNYPGALVSFLTSLVNAIRSGDFAGLGGQLSRLFLPTMVLVMLATMAVQIGRVLVGKLNRVASTSGKNDTGISHISIWRKPKRSA